MNNFSSLQMVELLEYFINILLLYQYITCPLFEGRLPGDLPL
jgi:hypothetical protein